MLGGSRKRSEAILFGYKPKTINLKEHGFAKGESPANEANINAAFEKVKAVME